MTKDGDKTPETLRLSVYLARAGVASRRGAGDLVKDGLVEVNGQTETNPGTPIRLGIDHVRVDGKSIKKLEPHVYLMLNKPAGMITTRSDPEERPTVFDLLHRVKFRVEAVGRLDWDTEGLLLLTNDGDLAQFLMRPQNKVEKVYDALVEGKVGGKTVQQLEAGVKIEGRKTKPARVKLLGKPTNVSLLRLKIVEGKYHQVKRMCDVVGHPVKKLRRI
ncbi:rRNA pseudouridine synthase, partial [bacterium]|nr:rRNA pseudouridine synthase [bacterium]